MRESSVAILIEVMRKTYGLVEGNITLGSICKFSHVVIFAVTTVKPLLPSMMLSWLSRPILRPQCSDATFEMYSFFIYFFS